ncbi:hypothetical protein GOODEAATRI_008229 [Goodea atripinnis]|uniref:Uncharacterized protein n=1 Tax=Goodea atripinnis TaxID=208336 RepID=A0ABV0PM34_9TELE
MSTNVTAASSTGRVRFHSSPFRSRQVQKSQSGLFEEEEIQGWVNIRALIAGITRPMYHGDNCLFSR